MDNQPQPQQFTPDANNNGGIFSNNPQQPNVQPQPLSSQTQSRVFKKRYYIIGASLIFISILLFVVLYVWADKHSNNAPTYFYPGLLGWLDPGIGSLFVSLMIWLCLFIGSTFLTSGIFYDWLHKTSSFIYRMGGLLVLSLFFFVGLAVLTYIVGFFFALFLVGFAPGAGA
jgi:magnesium-transporting ATPase (P-type)